MNFRPSNATPPCKVPPGRPPSLAPFPPPLVVVFVCAGCFDNVDQMLFDVDAGNFSSPGFPVALPVEPIFCEWKINMRAFRRVQLHFHVVDLPSLLAADGREGDGSFLAYGDFNPFGQRMEYRRVHGRPTTEPSPFVSNGLGAWVTLYSSGDRRQQHRGLLVEVSRPFYGQMSPYPRHDRAVLEGIALRDQAPPKYSFVKPGLSQDFFLLRRRKL